MKAFLNRPKINNIMYVLLFNLLNFSYRMVFVIRSDSVTSKEAKIFNVLHLYFRLEFPIVLVVYQDMFISVHAINVLIRFVDRRQFCSSDDLLETFNSPASPYCTYSGMY